MSKSQTTSYVSKHHVAHVTLGLGERIKFERERLKLSQADFADKVGISRPTQVNYEKGRHIPDAQYLARLGGVGADLDYVLFGERASKKLYALQANRVLPLVARRVKIDYPSLLEILVLVAQDEADALEKPGPEINLISDEKLQSLVAALFYKEGRLLREVLLSVGQVLQEMKARLAAARKADIVLALYQEFQASGKVEKRIAEAAVRVAIFDTITVRDRRTRKTILPGHLE